MPVYPTSSPFVLSVGGTQFSPEDYGPGMCTPAEPCGWTGGGGGFSWLSAAPPFQQAGGVTARYVAAAQRTRIMAGLNGTYNAGGRGYPDVAALAAFGIPLCDYGGCSGSGGTSASAVRLRPLALLAAY